MSTRKILVATALAATLILGAGCDAEVVQNLNDDLAEAGLGFGVDLSDPNAVFEGSVLVLDQARQPVEGATLTLGDQTFTSGADGVLTLTGLTVGNVLSGSVRAEGFMGYPIQADFSFVGQAQAVVQLMPVLATVTLDSADGGSIDAANVKVTFTGGTFVDANGNAYEGDVVVNLGNFDPDNQAFSEVDDDKNLVLRKDMSSDKMPKGFFVSSDSDGNVSTALPQNVLVVEMQDKDGNPLQLKEGTTAEVRIGLPGLTASKPGETLNLMYYDEALSMWKQSGTCTVQTIPNPVGTSALECVGSVDHFTAYTASEEYGVPQCLKFDVQFTKALEAELEGMTRSQKIEILNGAKNADGTYPIQYKDNGLNSKYQQCYIGPDRDYFSRVVVTFTASDNTTRVFTSAWTSAARKSLSSGDVSVLCESCEAVTVTFGAEETAEPLVDADGDGFATVQVGNKRADCDDADRLVYPGASEHVCAEKDYDCDVSNDRTQPFELPRDHDIGEVENWNNVVCSYKKEYPTCAKYSPEVGGNNIDENCDGKIPDRDGDGEFGLIDGGNDCNDTNKAVNSSASEVSGNTDDENCDGVFLDEDNDGYWSQAQIDALGADLEADCNDKDASINPEGTETPGDGIDQDCDGEDATTGVNECLGEIDCSENASCSDPDIEVSNNYECTCNEGYTGNGITCNPLSIEVAANDIFESDSAANWVEITPPGQTKYEFDCDGNGVFEVDNGTNNGYVCPQGVRDGPSTTKITGRATFGASGMVTNHTYANVVTVAPSPDSNMLEPWLCVSEAIPELALDAAPVTDGVDALTKVEFDCDGNGVFEVDNGSATDYSCIYNPEIQVYDVFDVGVRLTDADGDKRTTVFGSYAAHVSDPECGGGLPF